MSSKKIKYTYRGATRKLLSFITRAMQKDMKLGEISKRLRNIVNSYEGLNKNERYQLYAEAYSLARASKNSKDWRNKISLRESYDSIVTTARKVKAHSNLRHKKQAVRKGLQDPTVLFFLCSSHVNPAKDHKDYQGIIYVDRYWRTKCSGALYVKVWRYINNHQIATVQEIMGPPVYLTTRPYCKHFFIPLDTYTVLTSSQKKIRKYYGVQRDPVYNDEAYYKFRREVYEKLNDIEPCEQFKKKAAGR